MKKVKKIISIVMVIIIVLNALTTLCVSLIKKSKLKNYNDKGTINSYATYFGADLSAINQTKRGEFKFLTHNDGKPIYVTFSNCSPEVEENFTSVLDYVFSYLSQINGKYTYKVASAKSNFFSDTTVLEIKGNNLSCSITSGAKNSFARFITSKQYVNRYEIKFDKDDFENNLTEIEKYNLILKEIMYALQFSHTASNSFIESSTITDYGKFTPNDLRSLASVYAPKLSTSEKNDYVSKINDIITPLEEIYCEDLTSQITDYVPITLDPFKVVLFTETTLENRTDMIYYSIIVEGNKYWFGTYNTNFDLVNKRIGVCKNVNGLLVLKNVKLTHNILNVSEKQSYFSDIVCYQKDADNYDLFTVKDKNLNLTTGLKPGEKDYGVFELREHILNK